MRCPSCEFENPEKLKFCGSCGERLPTGCPECGYDNPPGFKFCGECGQALGDQARPAPEPSSYTPKHLADKILTSRAAIEGERKRVTVLFADVQGSMDLAERLDPEEWHGVLDSFFSIITDGIHRFEGNVNQYTGDGVMALFGAPIAHEDHAQRACYAALHLQGELARYSTEVKRTHGLGFSVRMGIHSGEVVVGKIGDDLRMDYTAQGHTVGLAARMQTLASPDTCYLTNATETIVSAYFDLEDLGEFDIKGVRAPIPVFRLKGTGSARTRFDVSRARGLTRFVGRDGDMQTLDNALEQARAGNGQVVGVVADAGTGKSRLCFEFAEQCRANGLQVLEGSAVAHGKNIPFLPMLQVFRAYYGISEADNDRATREKIAGRVLLIDDSFREQLPLLFDFFGVPDPDQPPPPMDPDARRRQLIAAMRRLLQAEDANQPLFTLVEDLHWIDSGSEGLLEEMVNAVAGTRHLILVNFRPEYHAEWMQKSWYRQLPLAPLGPEAIRELLQDLLGGDPSTAGLADAIHTRTQGNPFFTEEVVQSLIEDGHLEGTRGAYRLVAPVESLTVPARVESVLAARIDRLGEREKQILQTAAVIGKEFSGLVLEAVAELPQEELVAGLATLRSGEFIYEQALYPSVVYSFRHPLTQEVALGSQLHERRRVVHAAVAETIEKLYPDELDERAALLAHHYEAAGKALPAAHWHRRAGDWARATDREAAGFHFERIAALADELEDGREADELAMVACTRILDQRWRTGIELAEARAFFDRGEELAVRLGDLGARGTLRNVYGRAALSAGVISERMRTGEEALVIAEEGGDVDGKAEALLCMADACNFWGRVDEMYAHSDRFLALDRSPELGIETYGVSLLGVCHFFQGLTHAFHGDFADADAAFDRAHAVARELNQPELDCWAYGYAAWSSRLAGEPERALERARRAGEAARAAGDSPHLLGMEQRSLFQAHFAAGDGPAAREAAESFLQVLIDAGTERPMQAEGPALIASAILLGGDVEAALPAARHAADVAEKMGRLETEIIAQGTIAGALVARAETAHDPEIESAIARIEWLIEETGARLCRAELFELRGQIAEARGEADRAEAAREEGRRLYTEMNAPRRAAQV